MDLLKLAAEKLANNIITKDVKNITTPIIEKL